VTTRADQGFTLIEALVAFVILALGLQAALHVFSGNRRQAEFAQSQRTATMLAQSTLDAIGAELPLQRATRAGDLDGGFHWRVVIDEYVDPADGRPVNIAAYNVAVSVSWGKAAPNETVTLRTLRLAPKSQ
jgi:general secretion pathway protein I